MKAKYIFRLDDASPFSNSRKWHDISSIFQKHNIKPIVAVIPDNKDPTLMHQRENLDFWNMVKHWEDKGWSIAMHGYQHLFHAVPREKSIVPYYDRSEFSGLKLNSQKEKIKKSLKVFLENNIEPTVWVAPAHSFDHVTLEAITDETSIRVVSDGIALFPYFESGFYFIPQQIWNVQRKVFGIWTICLHPDNMTDEEIQDLDFRLSSTGVACHTISVQDLLLSKKGKGFLDRGFSVFYWIRRDIARVIKRWIN